MKKLISILITLTMLITSAVPAFAAGTTVSLETDKTEYEYGENIVVTATGGTSTAWVGIYNKGDKPESSSNGGVPSLFWYYSNNDDNKGKSIVIQGKGHTNRTLPAGVYEIHLFNDEGYTVLKTVEITITGGPEDGDDSGTGEPDDKELTDCKLASISYDLDNDTDGFANGTVTITADSSAVSGADCIMYWADEKGEPLEGYTPLAKFRLTGEVTAHEMYDYTIIPEGAETLIAYLSNNGSLIGDAVSTDLPEGCNYIIEDDYNVEFQLISDIHIQEGNSAYNTHFTQMLEDVRINSPKSIGIFVNGDIADGGKQAQYEKLVSLYDAVKAKGGIPELHLAIGNHDWMDGNPDGQFQKYVNKLNPAVQTETVYYDETIAGYHFIYLGGEQSGGNAVLSEKQLAWFDNRMKEITAEDPEKPVFVLLHQPLYNTVAGSLPGQGWHGVNNEQNLRDVLKKYDQIIIAGGHSHWELDSLENMYPGDDNMSIAVNTASVAYLWTSYNVDGGEYAPGSHGYFVRVYDDKVLFLGRDIENSRFVSSGMFVVEKNHITPSKEEYTLDLENNLVDMKASAAGGGELTFKSSNTDVVAALEGGVLKAKKEGTATITITAPATDRYVKNSEKVQVTVVDKTEEEEPPVDPPVNPPEEDSDEPVHVHNYVKFVTEPTCTAKGYTTYKCSCGDTYKSNGVTALDHSWDNGEVIVEATCTKEGKQLFTCNREGCGASKVGTIAVDKDNHSYTATVTSPTCIAKGYTTYKCACGEISTGDEVSALKHDWNEGEVISEATCTKEGKNLLTCKRENCGVAKVETTAVDKDNHSYTTTVTPPTCIAKGYTTYKCVCGDMYTGDEVSALNHDWNEGEVIAESTCTKEGKQSFTCKRENCGVVKLEIIAVDKDNHSYTATVTPPTCITKGYTTYKCACGDMYTGDEVSALNHDWNEGGVIAESTCTKEGKNLLTCKREDCEADKVETIAVDKEKHNYSKVTIEPTCVTEGYTMYICACGHTYKNGVVDANGHKFGEYVIDVPATFANEGTKIAKCENKDCGEKREISISKVMAPVLSSYAYAFDNKTKTPTVTVVDTEGNAVPVDVKFDNDIRKSVGKYAVTVELLGQAHSGNETVHFVINPVGRSISKLTSGKKVMTVKWKKPSATYRKQMTGYEIKYSTSSKMTSAKTVTVKSTKATSKTIKKLKSKKYYYVQLRTYKTISGEKYYSSWSKTKKVKIK